LLSSQLALIAGFPRPKRVLAPIDDLTEYAVSITTMKKYICILAGAALLAACEQKTETTPSASPAATASPETAATAIPEATTPATETAPATSPTP
jgi:hypothetical protein